MLVGKLSLIDNYKAYTKELKEIGDTSKWPTV
jgi:hypothetical protein